jgi:hypothetical protein
VRRQEKLQPPISTNKREKKYQRTPAGKTLALPTASKKMILSSMILSKIFTSSRRSK